MQLAELEICQLPNCACRHIIFVENDLPEDDRNVVHFLTPFGAVGFNIQHS